MGIFWIFEEIAKKLLHKSESPAENCRGVLFEYLFWEGSTSRRGQEYLFVELPLLGGTDDDFFWHDLPRLPLFEYFWSTFAARRAPLAGSAAQAGWPGYTDLEKAALSWPSWARQAALARGASSG